MKIPFTQFSTAVLGILTLSACEQGFLVPDSSRTTSTTTEAELAARAARSVTVRLHHSDFFSVTDPNRSYCAGDTRTYYQGPEYAENLTAFSESSTDYGMTLKPAFIRNVSVDVTDSGVNSSSNLAYSCSYGSASGGPPVSSCATFDYGAVQGIQTSLGGSLLLLGGFSGRNYAHYRDFNDQGVSLSCGPVISNPASANSVGVSSCSAELYALGIDVLPAAMATQPPSALVPGLTSASEPISSWSRLSTSSDYSGPAGAAGAAIAYQTESQKILVYSGATQAQVGNPLSGGYDSILTWIYDIKSALWKSLTSFASATSVIAQRFDNTSKADGTACGGTDCVMLQPSQSAGGRAYAGYTAVPGTAVTAMTVNGEVTVGTTDVTDRVLVAGGVTSFDAHGNPTVSRSTYKFNPTFGPEWVNLDADHGAPTQRTQWLEANPVQLLNTRASNHGPLTFGAAAVKELTGFGTAWVRHGVAPFSGTLLTAGGFKANEAYSDGTVGGGHLALLERQDPAHEVKADQYSWIGTYNQVNDLAGALNKGDPLAYGRWSAVAEAGALTVPHFGGMSVIPGLSLATNDVVLFGGVNCRDYLTKSGANCHVASGTSDNVSTNVAAAGNTTTKYWRLGANVTGGTLVDLSGATEIAVLGTGPAATSLRAGMATARGLDGGGKPIVVAWGGVSSVVGSADDPKIYYLYNADASGVTMVPTWANTNPSYRPTPAADATLVFSHVTGKFYLFGGLETTPARRLSGDTWELSVSGTCASGGCSFIWRKMNENNLISCHPDCTTGPSPRRGHRMTEVNYNNTDPTSEYTSCPSTAPCSFGIFMEGGISTGSAPHADRWMFDPTANGGRGHWQRVNDFPPRRLAGMAPLTFTSPFSGKNVRWALLFGGESGLHSPYQAATGKYFVPPTFGDTLVFNFQTETWSRVQLLGTGIHDYTTAGDTRSEWEKRQSYQSNDTDTNRALLSTLAPPALSGAIMVTRTHSAGIKTSSAAVDPLRVPEIYLIGGRLKDGSYSTLDHVYKFCAGSPGEDPVNNNGHCDAYHETLNPDSLAPKSDAVGRWLRKRPFTTNGLDPSTLSSFMGAGTYDPNRDRVVLVGGLSPQTAGTKVTRPRSIAIGVYEYTPPSMSLTPDTPNDAGLTVAQRSALHGTWSRILTCSDSSEPQGRYGHTVSFDPLNDQIVLVGGYDVFGDPLTQYWLNDGVESTTEIPEIWIARRNDASTCYSWRQITTFGNTYDSSSPAMPIGGIGHAAGLFVPSTGYNTGYYTLQDQFCAQAGPLVTNDSETNKLLAGGVYIDLDRKELETGENLLLSLTYIPLGPENQRPDGDRFQPSQEAYFRIHLEKTNLAAAIIQQIIQPRHIQFSDDFRYPKVVQTLAVNSLPTGGVRQEQIVLPLSVDTEIDRIRIERYSGSAVLINVTLHRLGVK